MLETRFRIPVAPSRSLVRRRLLATGPRSIAGNMRIPESFGMGSPWSSLGATTANAADQEIAKVRTK